MYPCKFNEPKTISLPSSLSQLQKNVHSRPFSNKKVENFGTFPTTEEKHPQNNIKYKIHLKYFQYANDN